MRLEPWQRAGVIYLLRTRPRPPTSRQRRVMAALLRDHRRPNTAVAREAGVADTTVAAVRRELTAAALIEPWKPGPGPERQRVIEALLANPRRSVTEVAFDVSVGRTTAWRVRHELEAAGAIEAWRAGPAPG